MPQAKQVAIEPPMYLKLSRLWRIVLSANEAKCLTPEAFSGYKRTLRAVANIAGCSIEDKELLEL